MLKKVLTIFSLVVLSLFTLSIFGWMVFHISKGDRKFGFLTEPVKFMYSFPDLFSQSVEEVKSLPQTFIPTPDSFQTINNLEADFIVFTTYSDTSDSRSIVLLNLRNDSVQYKWTVKNPHKEYDRIENPLLYPDKSLVYSFSSISGLQRIDSLGNLIWRQDSLHHHHSMNKDKHGDIWVCSFEPVFYATGWYKFDGRTVFYIDNYITKVDAATGRMLFHKSITEILKENNLEDYLFKSANVRDPIHINDVQPALKTTPFYREDDLFISSRNLSLVMHYRPSTNKVINVIEGPFTSQHDVDFLNDSTLVIFNNNYYNSTSNDFKEPPKDSARLVFAGDFYSNIVRYNLRDHSFSFIGDSIFRANKIFTRTEGLMEFVDPSTYFVEEQNPGVIWIIKDERVLYKNAYRSQHEGYHHLPNWSRVIAYDE
ncbi:MAG: arylsulfotransferase family protein [Bacteroidales bacterium]